MDNESNKKESKGKKLTSRRNSKSNNSNLNRRADDGGSSFENIRHSSDEDTRTSTPPRTPEKVGCNKVISKIKIEDRIFSPRKTLPKDVHSRKIVDIKEDLNEAFESDSKESKSKIGKNNVSDARGSKKILKRKIEEESAAGTSGASTGASDTDADDKDPSKDKKKKNRCAVCRKKVGLTGFECRCGGLFCAVHRYSDKHECSFDYRELGAQEIRRNNPVVVSQKIHKI